MAEQVNILPQLESGGTERMVVGLMTDGPRCVGHNIEEARLSEAVGYGRILGLAPLELLIRLAQSEHDEQQDRMLIRGLTEKFNAKQGQLRFLTDKFRAIPSESGLGTDAWAPVAPVADTTMLHDDIAFPPDRLFAVFVPLLFRVSANGYEHVSHSGQVDLSLSARELSALRHLTTPVTRDDLHSRASTGEEQLTPTECDALMEQLQESRILLSFAEGDEKLKTKYSYDTSSSDNEVRVSKKLFDAISRAEDRHPRLSGTVPVYPVNFDWAIIPLSLGYIFASARKYKDGSLSKTFDFRPNWLTNQAEPVPKGAAIMMYSHYIWTSKRLLDWAAKVKEENPLAVNIHGGPDVPKYAGDVEWYFKEHPYVDIAVHGEGEVTASEMLEALGPGLLTGEPIDLSVLDGVPGLSYRGADGLAVRTADRERIKDLNEIPSPFLTGEFEVWGEASVPSAILESNRGCPYGCTFCDWGSATASRIRKFDLEIVYAELEWCAHHSIDSVAFADANFGIFERDVDIARRTAELKKEHGAPRKLGTNYAKNSVKHLKPIIEILVEADILAMGLLSLQSMDEGTLTVINRSNIKLAKYDALAKEFRDNNLPLYVDLMMGLPGATVESFQNDMQECIDREVYPKIYPTQLLVNSPMNEPAYRAEHGIVTKPGQLVTSCNSFSEQDYLDMGVLRRIYLLAEKFGILRHALRYARHETGLREIDLLLRIMSAVDNNTKRWPALKFGLMFTPSLMTTPLDWGWFLSDLHRFFVEQLGIKDDAALDSALRAQHAMLPAPERKFPATYELPCDYAGWYADILHAKENGHREDWSEVVAPLRSYGPGSLTVTDPIEICTMGLGQNFNLITWSLWEMTSEIARPSNGTLAYMQ